MIRVWICYHTVLWLLFQACTILDRNNSPHRPHHELQLHPRYAKMRPWFWDPRYWTMHIISWRVGERWCYMYGYDVQLFYEYHTRHEPRLSVVDKHYHLQLHHRHAQIIPCILEPRVWTMGLISGVMTQEWCTRYGCSILLFHECYKRHGPHLTWVDHSAAKSMTSYYTLDMIRCYTGYWNQEFESCTSIVV